jgi:hypothetical protein
VISSSLRILDIISSYLSFQSPTSISNSATTVAGAVD